MKRLALLLPGLLVVLALLPAQLVVTRDGATVKANVAAAEDGGSGGRRGGSGTFPDANNPGASPGSSPGAGGSPNASNVSPPPRPKITAEETGLPTSTTDLGDALTKITVLLFSVVGGLAVIFIIVGGLQLATSNGDPGRIKQGKDTLTYSIIGLILAVAAGAIVSFIGERL
jgi:hypothetical protein